MNTFSIGPVTVDIADFLDTRDDDGNLVAYFPDADFANARFSVVTVSRDGVGVSGAGEKIVRERAEDAGKELHSEGRFVWYYTSEDASEGSPGSLMHYWYVGMDAHVIIASCFIDSAYRDSDDAKRVFAAVQDAVNSLRID